MATRADNYRQANALLDEADKREQAGDPDKIVDRLVARAAVHAQLATVDRVISQ